MAKKWTKETVEKNRQESIKILQRKREQEYNRQHWRTPKTLFDSLDSIFHFTVDACADKDNALCKKYWTECKGKDWSKHTVFCNPPFKGYDSIIPYAPLAITTVFFLLANTLASKTVMKKFPPAFLVIPDYRIEYEPAAGIRKSKPTDGTVFLVYGKVSKSQIARLKALGTIWKPE